jgi:hypothetical protein
MRDEYAISCEDSLVRAVKEETGHIQEALNTLLTCLSHM